MKCIESWFFLLITGLFANIAASKHLIRIEGKKPTHGILPQKSFKADDKPQTINDQLKAIASAKPENSGTPLIEFSLPKIRGFESKYSTLWFDNILLYDPLIDISTLPNLDLKSLGQVDIYCGLSPWHLGQMSSSMSIVLQTDKSKKRQTLVGTKTGFPYEISIYGKDKEVFTYDSFEAGVQIFAKKASSDGDYEYYDDQANPFNSTEGRIRRRENNYAQTWQIFPFGYVNYDRHKFKFYYWQFDDLFGLSGMGKSKSKAHKKQKQNLKSISYKYTLFDTDSLKWKIGSSIALKKIDQHIKDPEQNILLREKEKKRVNEIFHYNIFSRLEKDYFSAHTSWKKSLANFHESQEKNSSLNHTRTLDTFFVGSQWRFFIPLTLEHKIDIKQCSDKNKDSSEKIEHNFIDQSLSLILDKNHYQIHIQAAYLNQLPSLYELFGDGFFIQKSLSLVPENIIHGEIGFQIGKHKKIGMIFFVDDIKNKIQIVPVSFTQFRAKNFQHRRQLGLEILLEVNLNDNLFYANNSFLHVYDVEKGYLVPKTPLFMSKAGWRRKTLYGDLGWDMTYEGLSFENTNQSAWTEKIVLHDLFYKKNFSLSTGKIDISARIDNLFDIKKIKIQANHEQSGYIARQEVLGFPLPGRTFTLDISWQF